MNKIVKSHLINSRIEKHNILFFDMDGTLIDTDYANYLAYQKAIQIVIGHKQPVQFNNHVRFDKSLLIHFFPDLNQEEYDAIISLKGALYEEFLSETKLNHDLVNVLCHSVSNNQQTVLVTNANRARALLTLKHHGIVSYFNQMFFGNCVTDQRTKYEHAICSLKIDPEQVIIFENDLKEINHALSTGVLSHNIIYI